MRDPSSEYFNATREVRTPLTLPHQDCPANVAARADYPAGFMDNPRAPCGIPHPEQILSNLSGCCDGPVEISNGCFQYCQTGLDMISFAECVRVTVAIDPHFITTCNKTAAETPAEDDVDADLAHDLAESNGWLSYMWRRLRRVLEPEHDGL